MATWAEADAAATAAVAKQKWNKAIGAVAPWLAQVQPELEGAAWARALAVLAAAGTAIDPDFQPIAERAAAKPDDAKALYDAGHALVSARRPDLAIAILARAAERSSSKGAAVAELVAALELLARNREAIDVLDGDPALTAGDPLLSYLRAFNAVTVADVETARGLLPRLKATNDDKLAFMAARIEGMVARADALRARGMLTAEDLRGWHYVLTGGVLERAARHDRTWDSPARVKASLLGLGVMIEALGLEVPALLHVAERTSEVLAGAAAALIGRPARVWHGDDARGLIIIYDLRNLIREYGAMAVQHRPGQPLYVRAADHTAEWPVAGDVLGYLYARNTSPWGPGFTQDNQLLDLSQVPAADLVRAVVDAGETDDPTDLKALRAWCETVRELDGDAAAAARRDRGQRERQWVGSPVGKT